MPSFELRARVLSQARSVVVKLGTQLLTATGSPDVAPSLDADYLANITTQIANLRRAGREVTLVCSGAVGAGCVELGLTTRPTDVADLQAVAAVGQRRLMTHLHDAFREHELAAGQLLLTRGDFEDRTRYLNIRNCVARLHELGCIPVLNENDTVAVDEIRFGDNDLLAAHMAGALQAEALVLLTVVDGLLPLDTDGRPQPGPPIDLIDDVRKYSDLAASGREAKSAWGSGGMSTKLEAARVVTDAGEVAVIANGREPEVLTRLFAGERLGTVVEPRERKLAGRQRWIAASARPTGTLAVDAGAVRALVERGKSLLAKGVTAVEGEFEAGDVVKISGPEGVEIGRGLSNYAAHEARLIAGRHSDDHADLLGRPAYSAVVHRDHLVVTAREPAGS